MSLIKDGLNSESMKLRDMIPWEKSVWAGVWNGGI